MHTVGRPERYPNTSSPACPLTVEREGEGGGREREAKGERERTKGEREDKGRERGQRERERTKGEREKGGWREVSGVRSLAHGSYLALLPGSFGPVSVRTVWGRN